MSTLESMDYFEYLSTKEAADGFYIAAVSPDVILDMIEQISLLQVALKHAYNGLNAIYHDPAK